MICRVGESNNAVRKHGMMLLSSEPGKFTNCPVIVWTSHAFKLETKYGSTLFKIKVPTEGFYSEQFCVWQRTF